MAHYVKDESELSPCRIKSSCFKYVSVKKKTHIKTLGEILDGHLYDVGVGKTFLSRKPKVEIREIHRFL